MSLNRTLIILLLLTAVNQDLHAQKRGNFIGRYINSIINDTTAAEKSTLMIYPTFASSPETKLELGLSGVKLFYANDDTTNRLSELQTFAFITLKAQYGIKFENAMYGHQDKWFFLGETKIQKFPLSYFGIGPLTSGDHPALVDAFQVAFKQRVLRKAGKNVFFGPDIDFQLLSGVSFRQPKDGPQHAIPLGGNGTHNLGLGLSLVYDSRHNVLNVRNGLFSEISYLNYSSGFLSQYNFGSLNMEVRSFHSLKKNNIIAWQIKGQFMNGNVPFHQMALVGGDKLMRGYYTGRFRDKNMIAGQIEYRILPFSFSKRLGAAFFAGAGVVAPSVRDLNLRNIQLAGGLGIRYLLFPKKDIYLRFDIGFTPEGLNMYILNGEAF